LTLTPLYEAEHADRYERQRIIERYRELTGADLIVVIDEFHARNLTVL